MKEYKIIACSVSNEALRQQAETHLGNLGKDGWQIISVNTIGSNQNTLIYTLERYIVSKK